MKPKHLMAVALIVGATGTSYAQYSQDAIRFSGYQAGSTSRIKAIGNAGTAVGGDLSSVSGNPAGIGFFTRSELSITPEFDGSKVNSGYFGKNTNDSKNNLNLNNFSVVFYNRLNTPKGSNKGEGWLSVNFGISYNRTNNFYENVRYGASNTKNSITDYYANDATGSDPNNNGLPDNSLGAWAYNQFLIDYYTSKHAYASNATGLNPNGVAQSYSALRTGGQDEISLSMGTNYSNKLYLGLALGITNLRYNTTNTFTESGIASIFLNPGTANQPYVNTYSQDQSSKGTGFNLKAGFIYKPVDAVRFGASITTPTWWNIDDNYNEGMTTKLNNNPSVYRDGPVNYPFSYQLRTPFRASGGLAVFIGKLGFISGDVEYLDYTSAHLDGDYTATNDNNEIRTLYRSTVNAHIGAEARLSSNLFLRGGYGTQGSPLKTDGTAINTTSGGLGYRNGPWYIDATYSHIAGKQTLYPYEVGTDSPAALLSRTNDNVYVTFGFRF